MPRTVTYVTSRMLNNNWQWFFSCCQIIYKLCILMFSATVGNCLQYRPTTDILQPMYAQYRHYILRESYRRREMWVILVTHVCVSVCLFLAACTHYCTDPDVT